MIDMSLETYLKRIIKPNDLPYVKQAIKEWLYIEYENHCCGKFCCIYLLIEELEK